MFLTTIRFKNSFVPAAINVFNSWHLICAMCDGITYYCLICFTDTYLIYSYITDLVYTAALSLVCVCEGGALLQLSLFPVFVCLWLMCLGGVEAHYREL